MPKSPAATSTRAPRSVVAPQVYERPTVVAQVCDEVAGGDTLRAILAAPGMPNRSQLFRWLQADPALLERYRDARAFAADLLFEELEEDAAGATKCTSMVEVAALRLKLDMQRWVLSKRCPKRYGDKVDLLSDGQSLQVFTLGISTV